MENSRAKQASQNLIQSFWQWSRCKECQVENINGLCGGLVHIVLASLASRTSNSSSSACWQDYSIIHLEKEGAGRDPACKGQTYYSSIWESFTSALDMICPHQSSTCPSQHEAKSGNQWLQPGIMAILHSSNGLLPVLLEVMSCPGLEESIRLPGCLCD